MSGKYVLWSIYFDIIVLARMSIWVGDLPIFGSQLGPNWDQFGPNSDQLWPKRDPTGDSGSLGCYMWASSRDTSRRIDDRNEVINISRINEIRLPGKRHLWHSRPSEGGSADCSDLGTHFFTKCGLPWAPFTYPVPLLVINKLRVSFSSGRDRFRRHDWICAFWTPCGKLLLYLNGGPSPY